MAISGVSASAQFRPIVTGPKQEALATSQEATLKTDADLKRTRETTLIELVDSIPRRKLSETGPSQDTTGNERGNNAREQQDTLKIRQQLARERAQMQAAELQERAAIAKLQKIDRAVRAHEAAHAAVGGALAGSPRFSFERGPDGRQYAVSGEVSISLSTPTHDPKETLTRMQTVQRAALAPADPSIQDRLVAARAQGIAAQARVEIARQRSEATSQERSVQQDQRLADKKAETEAQEAEAIAKKAQENAEQDAALATPEFSENLARIEQRQAA